MILLSDNNQVDIVVSFYMTYRLIHYHLVRTLYVQVSKDSAFKSVELQELTAQELTLRLCKAMSLCTDSVSEVVWRRKEGNQLLVLVDDAVVNYHFYDNLKLLAGYQLKSDGTARIILDY